MRIRPSPGNPRNGPGFAQVWWRKKILHRERQSQNLHVTEHFLNGEWSRVQGHPSFTPTIFKTKHVKEKTEVDLARFQRHQQGQLLKQQGELCHKCWYFAMHY